MHRRAPRPIWAAELRSVALWTLGVPAAALLLGARVPGAQLVLVPAYLLLGQRVFRHRLRKGDRPDDAALYATFCVVGKLPQLVGALTFAANRIAGRRTRLMEYKAAEAAVPAG